MTRRLLTGLSGLLVLVVGMVGLPAFLLAAQGELADLMPALGELPGALLAPGDGGLFLLTLFGVGWACWVVFVVAFVVELVSRARGVRTPHLGPFLPQRTAAWAITAVTLLASISPTADSAPPPTSSSVAVSVPFAAPGFTQRAAGVHPQAQGGADTHQHQPAEQDHEEPAAHVDADGVPWRDYRVQRGDTLWDIADRKLDDPTEWPEIADASDEIRQPSGGRLEDPDLILPGWTLHIPRREAESSEGASERSDGGAETPGQGSPHAAPDASSAAPPRSTPLRPPASEGPQATPGRGASALSPESSLLPTTPFHPQMAEGRTGAALEPRADLPLPQWVRAPLTPTAFEDGPTSTRTLVLAALAKLPSTAPRPASNS